MANLVADLGWFDLDSECSTVCQLLSGLEEIQQKRLDGTTKYKSSQRQTKVRDQLVHPVDYTASNLIWRRRNHPRNLLLLERRVQGAVEHRRLQRLVDFGCASATASHGPLASSIAGCAVFSLGRDTKDMAVDSRLGLGIKLLDLEADNELFL